MIGVIIVFSIVAQQVAGLIGSHFLNGVTTCYGSMQAATSCAILVVLVSSEALFVQNMGTVADIAGKILLQI